MKLSNGSEMVLTSEAADRSGFVHYKFRQQYKEVPIFGNTYILHEQNGIIKSANGHYTPMADVNTTPAFSADDALKLLKIAVKAKRYSDHQHAPTLYLIDPAFPKTSGQLKLAYKVELETFEPYNKVRYFLDAEEGTIITKFPLMHNEGVPSTAHTKYYGVQNIITDSIGPGSYRLHDPTRGDGITIVDNSSGDVFINDSPVWDLGNDVQDEVALDAHYCTQQYYDMMLEKFDWKGYDGNGGEMICTVHNNGAGPVNAFWNGVTTNYGDGNCTRGPLTTLEVVAHEWTHGMIDFTSNLVYSSESGAMNESLADMFGKMAEYYYDPANFKWLLGHSFLLTPDAEPFRVMNDPASVNMPPYYKGDLWNDGGGVHTNSAVGNLWFVMIVDGMEGTNEAGYDYDVQGIGMEKAGQIAFNTNRGYLMENSTYNDFYTYSIEVAEQLYGAGSPEVETVTEAWKAVGLPYTTASEGFDLSIEGGFFYERTCGFNVAHPVVIEVANIGATTYDSTNAKLIFSTFDNSLPDTTIAITDTIEPGEVLSITMNDWFNVTEDGFYSFDIQLDFQDDNLDNHQRSLNYRIYEHHADDLSITTAMITPDCFAPTMETIFYLGNRSCDTIKAGTIVNLSIENQSSQTLWSESYEFLVDILPFRTAFAFYDLDLGLNNAEELLFKLEYADDPGLENNEYLATTPYIITIDDDYLNEFTDELELENYIEYDHAFNDPIGTYNDENYFITSGRFDDPEEFDACPDFEDVFDYSGFRSGIYGEMKLCVDYSAYSSSYLKFDLIQFRNEFATLDNNEHTSMLQTAWDGTASNEIIIYGQEEGEIINHEYALPANFKGELTFKFYTELGDYNFSTDEFDFNYDLLLMDNLELLSDFTSTTELEKGELINISPNPTTGQLNITADDVLIKYELSSINGQLIQQQKLNSNSFEMDLSSFKNGLYLLRVQNINGEWAVKKVVKM